MTTPVDNPVTQSLATLLADSYALMGQTHFAHWNVQGRDFFQLHTAFQTQYEELFTAVDELAERLRALGAIAPGGLKTLAARSKVTELEQPVSGPDWVKHLIQCHETTVASAGILRDRAGELGDAETQDLAIGRIQIHQKTIWMLRSFLG